jgi:O-acetylhomoserine (thiol)-lyase
MRTVPLRNLGACIAPDNSWFFLQGIETLPLRMERHCQNALAVAQYLKKHPRVEWVRFPGLPEDPMYALNQKYLRGKGGSMVVFGIKGGAAAGRQFIDSLRLFSHLANVGDAKSLAIHPATTTHSQLTEEAQRAGGITPELVRLSIGLEHIDDILADLDQALAAASRA